MAQTLPTHQVSVCIELRTNFADKSYSRSSLALALTLVKHGRRPIT